MVQDPSIMLMFKSSLPLPVFTHNKAGPLFDDVQETYVKNKENCFYLGLQSVCLFGCGNTDVLHCILWFLFQ
jgi:hypothetical protein